MLHRPATWFRSRLQQIPSPPCSSFDSVFFGSFLPKTLRFASQVVTISYYALLPNIADRRGDTLQRRSLYHGTALTAKIPQGFPPIASSKKLISSCPASVNSCARRSLRFVDIQLIKTAEFLCFAHTSSQIEGAAHSKRFSTRRNSSQTTRPEVTQSQTPMNQHMKRLARVFQITSAGARNHLLHSVQQKKKITWVERFQCAHSKVQARSSRKTTTSTRVRDSGTV